MELPTQIVVGSALLLGAGVLSHFFYVAIKTPENMNLGIAKEGYFPRAFAARIYLGLVVISWATFAFSGAYGLLFWLPDTSALTLASVVAFLSLGLLEHVERSAYVLHAYRRERWVSNEFDKLINSGTIPSESLIEGFRKKSKSEVVISDRDGYAEMAELASALAKRDKKLCEYAVIQAHREAAEQADAQQKADRLTKVQTDKHIYRASLSHALDVSMVSLPIVKIIDRANTELEVIIESNVVKKKWNILCDFGERLRRLGEGAPILVLIQEVAGVQLIHDVTFGMVLVGNERDGHYDIFSVRDGARGPITEGLVFETSIDGILAAFFLRAALPGHLSWGHGCYDRDQVFIFTKEQVISIIEDAHISAENAGLKALTMPLGFRICRAANEVLLVKCLTYLPGKGLYDYAVSVDSGSASSVQETKCFQWGKGIYY